MISSKTIKFITQTKLHCETIWRTSMVLSRKHAVILYSYSISFFFFCNRKQKLALLQKSTVSYIAKQAGDNSAIESIHLQWLNCIFKELPFQHLVVTHSILNTIYHWINFYWLAFRFVSWIVLYVKVAKWCTASGWLFLCYSIVICPRYLPVQVFDQLSNNDTI